MLQHSLENLPDDVRRMVMPDGLDMRAGWNKGPGHLIRESDRENPPSVQRLSIPDNTVQSKPIPNLQGKRSDSELMFRFRTRDQAEMFYAFALTMLQPGEVNLVTVPENDQYSVHVMPHVGIERPQILRALMAEIQPVD
jgi:hypothetical protein